MRDKNLLLIMSDEHNPRFMGASGHPFIRTPRLDGLAQNGIRFTDAYTSCPICVPARASFATGKRVHQIRHWDNAMPYDGRERGWGHVLQEAGVRVESIGKLHYRDKEDPAGFDVEHIPMNVHQGVGMVWGSIRDPLPEHDKPRMMGDYIGPGESSYTEYDTAVADMAIEWLQDAATRRDGPWVLYVGFVAPHFPFVAPQKYFDLYPHDKLPPPKLHPRDGYVQHPWIAAADRFWPHEESFHSEEERLTAVAAYHALCTWLDDNVGRLLDVLANTGLAGDTRVIYTSDHGDNVGARGLWGKSNLYQESTAVPMILAGPDLPKGICRTPVDLIDLFPTILDAVGLDPTPEMESRPGRSLFDIARAPVNPERVIFSEYHAVGAVNAAFMVRKGRWKFHYYVGFEPELFDLETDPEEAIDRAGDPACAAVLAEMERELRNICDPEQVDALAKSDQADLVKHFGGRDAALNFGAPGATPPPARQVLDEIVDTVE